MFDTDGSPSTIEGDMPVPIILNGCDSGMRPPVRRTVCTSRPSGVYSSTYTGALLTAFVSAANPSPTRTARKFPSVKGRGAAGVVAEVGTFARPPNAAVVEPDIDGLRTGTGEIVVGSLSHVQGVVVEDLQLGVDVSKTKTPLAEETQSQEPPRDTTPRTAFPPG